MDMLQNIKQKWKKLKALFRVREELNRLAPHIYAASAQTLLKDNILEINNTLDGHKYGARYDKEIRFYLPFWKNDCIQGTIFKIFDFCFIPDLKKLDRYIPSNATILDIGANIGNHSVYWATVRGARKIYAFEPIKTTFAILEKNIALNALEHIITPYNFALGEQSIPKGAKVASYTPSNIGATMLCEVSNGGGAEALSHSEIADNIDIFSLDSLLLRDDFGSDTIDFVKIDVEGFEDKVLRGGKEFFTRYNPVVCVEVWDTAKLKKVTKIFEGYGYHLESRLQKLCCDYIFIKR